MSFSQKLFKLKENKNVKYGLPFLLLIVGGSFGLREFTKLRYQYSTQKIISEDELESAGIKMRKPEEVSLESEFEKIKDMDIENWQNVRGPRPWEEDTN